MEWGCRVSAFEPWQVVRIRDKVEEMAGRLDVKVYAGRNVFRIWYHRQEKVRLSVRIPWNQGTVKEAHRKTWPEHLQSAMNAPGTMINVEYESKPKWFGPKPDMRPVGELYAYIMSLVSS